MKSWKCTFLLFLLFKWKIAYVNSFFSSLISFGHALSKNLLRSSYLGQIKKSNLKHLKRYYRYTKVPVCFVSTTYWTFITILKICNLTLAMSPSCNSICPLPLSSHLLYLIPPGPSRDTPQLLLSLLRIIFLSYFPEFYGLHDNVYFTATHNRNLYSLWFLDSLSGDQFTTFF